MPRLTRPTRAAGLLLLAVFLLPLLPGLAGCRTIKARAAARAASRPAYRTLSPAVAYAMTLDAPDVLILDLRNPQEFQSETGHLRNARNIPLERLPYRMVELSGYRDDTLLVYCRGNDDTCGPEGMAILVASGFQDAMLIDGGIDRWIHDGFKTVLSVEGTAAPAPR
jgi:rhodanese-related sulfurtransferase